MRRVRLGVRARILSIALIPSVTLLAVGVGASTYLAVEAFQVRDDVAQLKTSVAPSIVFAEALQDERRLSLLLLAGDRSAADDLADARKRVDEIVKSPELLQAQHTIQEIAPELAASMGGDNAAADTLKAFAQMRQGVDAGLVPPEKVFQLYDTILDRVLIGVRGLMNHLPDADAVANASIAAELIGTAEAMSRGNAHGLAGSHKMTPQHLRHFSQQVGSYHDRLRTLLPVLSAGERDRAEALLQSPEWKALSTMENAIVDRGARGGPLPMSVANWQQAAATVDTELLDLFHDHWSAVVDDAVENSEDTATWWLVAGVAMLVGALLASLVTLRISGGLIRRLKRLRADALALADEHLPRIMARLRTGEHVDVDAEIASLSFGDDEIGDVAEAFNRAESAAVSAAIEEARTRDGVSAVFLNIAHRSQIVVHRQLELLDNAEHGEQDPNRLAVLFQLDHLSTRARRNAENLLILGGEQPGRQWRHPVPLVDLVRSAIAETEDYARVHAGPMAEVSIAGGVVADLIHLIAELVENATSFSPPESRVEVSSNVVGRGTVVEIVDQGVGMSAEQIARANATLREPPDFSVTNLSSDSRMGLLVVGQIAVRNGVTIRLTDSDYGGLRAIVLIPTPLIVADDRLVRVGGAGAGNQDFAVGSNGMPPQDGNGAGQVTGHGAGNTGPLTSTGPLTGSTAVPWPTADHGERAPQHAAYAEHGTAYQEPASATTRERQPTAGRPPLPRRRRQANLVPQLANSPQRQEPSPGGRRERSSDKARDLFSAIESGTREGRVARPDSGTGYHDRREGQR